jgi:HPt (histidine-containing phosphotransfer) domain-containing protein
MEYRFINTEYLESVSGGDPETICEIVDMFREQVVEIHSEMVNLYNERKYKSLGLLAHKAKSSVSIMGMEELAVLLKTFEVQARDEKEMHLYESYIEKFRTDTAAAITELDDLVRKYINRNE